MHTSVCQHRWCRFFFGCRYSMGVIPSQKSLALCDKLSVSSFCRWADESLFTSRIKLQYLIFETHGLNFQTSTCCCDCSAPLGWKPPRGRHIHWTRPYVSFLQIIVVRFLFYLNVFVCLMRCRHQSWTRYHHRACISGHPKHGRLCYLGRHFEDKKKSTSVQWKTWWLWSSELVISEKRS